MAESAAPVLVPSVGEALAVPSVSGDEELVDYEASPKCIHSEVNVVHLSLDYFVVRRRMWLTFSLVPVKLCSRSPVRRIIISRLFK